MAGHTWRSSFFGAVLTVCIECHNVARTAAQCIVDARLQSRALPKINGMTKHRCSRFKCLRTCIVVRTIVDYNDVVAQGAERLGERGPA